MILNSQPQHCNSCLNKVCAVIHVIPFLCLGTRQHFSITLRGHLLTLSPTKCKNTKNMAINKPQKGHLFTVCKLKQKCLVCPQLAMRISEDSNFYCCLHVFECHASATSIYFEDINNIGEFANMESRIN